MATSITTYDKTNAMVCSYSPWSIDLPAFTFWQRELQTYSGPFCSKLLLNNRWEANITVCPISGVLFTPLFKTWIMTERAPFHSLLNHPHFFLFLWIQGPLVRIDRRPSIWDACLQKQSSTTAIILASLWELHNWETLQFSLLNVIFINFTQLFRTFWIFL